MKLKITYLILITMLLSAFTVSAAIGFTKEDVEVVKSACLAGSSFDFTTEADGSISVKNLEGKGKLHISKEDVDTVDLPDADKKEEFKEIRNCIKDYLLQEKKVSTELSRTCQYVGGPKAGQIEYFPPQIPIISALIGQPCRDANGSWGTAIKDR